MAKDSYTVLNLCDMVIRLRLSLFAGRKMSHKQLVQIYFRTHFYRRISRVLIPKNTSGIMVPRIASLIKYLLL